MSFPLITQITEAEAQGAKELEQARLQARQRVQEAEARGQARITQRQQEAQAQARVLLDQAEQKAQNRAAIRQAQTETQCAKLEAKAKERQPQAVSYILGRIVNG